MDPTVWLRSVFLSVLAVVSATIALLLILEASSTSPLGSIFPPQPAPYIHIPNKEVIAKKDVPSDPGTSNLYITAFGPGRLGNQLLKYAALFAISRTEGNWTPIIKPNKFEYFRALFKNTTIKDSDIVMKKSTSQVDPSSNVTLRGYYTSTRYFTKVENHLREELQFSPQMTRRVEAYYRQVTPRMLKHSRVRCVGIHVRRGDMITKQQVEHGNALHPASYFHHAIDHFEQRYKKVVFIVASDDPTWCRANLNRTNVIFSNNNFAMDFALLTLCDDVIISLGTFSFWVGWLCKGTTVYYGKHPRPNSEMAEKCEDFKWIPPPKSEFNHWIPIV